VSAIDILYQLQGKTGLGDITSNLPEENLVTGSLDEFTVARGKLSD